MDEFSHQSDWRPPGKAETRIQELVVPFMQQVNRQPDLISLHSGSTFRNLCIVLTLTGDSSVGSCSMGSTRHQSQSQHFNAAIDRAHHMVVAQNSRNGLRASAPVAERSHMAAYKP